MMAIISYGYITWRRGRRIQTTEMMAIISSLYITWRRGRHSQTTEMMAIISSDYITWRRGRRIQTTDDAEARNDRGYRSSYNLRSGSSNG